MFFENQVHVRQVANNQLTQHTLISLQNTQMHLYEVELQYNKPNYISIEGFFSYIIKNTFYSWNGNVMEYTKPWTGKQF